MCCGTASSRCWPTGSASSATTTAVSGKSSVPKSVSAYTMACYADDFAAVIDAVAPGEPVHVLAHDWGSAGMWEYLARPGAGDRVASFTSVSGPSADHMNRFIIGSLKRPYRPRRFLQALESAVAVVLHGRFSVPVLAPLVVRDVLGRLASAAHADDPRRNSRRPAAPLRRPTSTDAANSLKVYRANYFKHDVARRGPITTSTCPCSSSSTRRIRSSGPTSTTTPRSGCRGCGGATSRPATGRRCRTRQVIARVGARVRRLPRGQAGEPGAAARAGRPSARILRRHTGFRDRRGQRHRPRDRARVRPRGCRSGDQRHRRGQASRTPPRRSPRAAASRTPTPSTSPTPTPSNGSPSR